MVRSWKTNNTSILVISCYMVAEPWGVSLNRLLTMEAAIRALAASKQMHDPHMSLQNQTIDNQIANSAASEELRKSNDVNRADMTAGTEAIMETLSNNGGNQNPEYRISLVVKSRDGKLGNSSSRHT